MDHHNPDHDSPTAPAPPGRRTGVVAALGGLAGAGLMFAVQALWPQGDARLAASQAAADAPPPMVLKLDGASAASAGADKPKPPSGPPVTVTTVVAVQRDVGVELEAPGTVVALQSVDIKPQISSVVSEVRVKEGQVVKRGQTLFRLDDRTERARLAQAQAQLAKSRAALADAERQLQRSRELFAQSFISQGALDAAVSAVESTRAVVQADQAAVEAVQVAFSYTVIAAPVGGRVGAVPVFKGSSVSPQGPALLTLTQLDPIGVSFALPQAQLPQLLASLDEGEASVQVQPADASAAALSGRLAFVDSQVDAASGTVKAKAHLGNARQRLWPGAYVRVKLAAAALKSAVVLPQASIIQSPKGSIVYVVDAQGRAQPTPVSVVLGQGDEVVATGVKPGQRVVLDGRQNLRPGSMVVEQGASPASADRSEKRAP